jgi:hypothetical protein
VEKERQVEWWDGEEQPGVEGPAPSVDDAGPQQVVSSPSAAQVLAQKEQVEQEQWELRVTAPEQLQVE